MRVDDRVEGDGDGQARAAARPRSTAASRRSPRSPGPTAHLAVAEAQRRHAARRRGRSRAPASPAAPPRHAPRDSCQRGVDERRGERRHRRSAAASRRRRRAIVSRTIAPASRADASRGGVLSAERKKVSSSPFHSGPARRKYVAPSVASGDVDGASAASRRYSRAPGSPAPAGAARSTHHGSRPAFGRSAQLRARCAGRRNRTAPSASPASRSVAPSRAR